MKNTFLIIGISVGAVIISVLLRKVLRLFIRKYASKLNVDHTNFNFLVNSIPFIIFSIAIVMVFYQIPALKNVSKALFAGAGIIAAIIGFASQKAFSNIIGGIFILIFKPFRVNDTIELPDTDKGIVEDITLRHTVIRNYENRRIIIPNNVISEYNIVNSNIKDMRIRKRIEVDVSYSSDIDKALKIMEHEVQNHPFCIDGRDQKEIDDGEPVVLTKVIALQDWSVRLRAWCWSNNNDEAFMLQCDVLKSIKESFDKNGIEIPYPYRNLVVRSLPKQEDVNV